ncbi:MAG: serine hydrolase domain-containing protein, partial [Bacteroidota bacterium]
ETHHMNGSGVLRYSFNESMQANGDATISWDPMLETYLDWQKLNRKIKIVGDRKFIEFKYQLQRPIEGGMSIGMNHMLVDKATSNGSKDFYTWTGNEFIETTYGRLGTVIILDTKTTIALLTGQLKWAKDRNQFPEQIILSRKDQPSWWVKAKVDANGAFSTMLPEGNYEVLLADALIKKPGGYFRVKLDARSSDIALNSADTTKMEVGISEIPFPNLLPEYGILQDGFSEADIPQIDEFVETYQRYYDIPGISLTIMHAGEIVYSQNYGVINYYTQVPVDSNTIFEGASMTKLMFAFAVLRLVEKSIIDLDKPLYKYTPPPTDIQDNPWHKLITGRMVLSHTTGLPNWADDMPDGKLVIQFKPGTQHSYSGAAFSYLTRAVEAITGDEITNILEDELVEVLDLDDMYFKNSPGLEDITAFGHVFNRPRWQDIPEFAEMASSVHTNSKAYAKFLLALSRRQGLRPETYEAMIHRSTFKNEHLEQGIMCKHYFGLGPNLRDSPFFGLSFGHSGSNGDFRCTSTIYEDTQNGFVVMTNASTGNMLQFHLHNLLNIGTQQVDP